MVAIAPLRACYDLSMSSELVRVSMADDIATIYMDDGKANALSHAMVNQLDAAFNQVKDNAKAVVLCGRDGRFCAGFDLSVMMRGPEHAHKLVIAGGTLLLRLYEYPRPIVIACTGHAVAAGILLAATGDIRIGATGSFKLGLNEVAVGLPVPILAHQFARDRLDTKELHAAVVLAKLYDPSGAVKAGWLDQLADPSEVIGVAHTVAKRLGDLPAAAYAASKRSLRQQSIDYIRETMESNIAAMTGSA